MQMRIAKYGTVATRVLLLIFSFSVPLFYFVGQSTASTVCPALTNDGKRLPLPAAAPSFDVAPNFANLSSEAMPEGFSEQARSIVSIYETGVKDGYGYISELDTLSVGISQWNIGTGSFYNTLLANVPLSAINSAEPQLRGDLIAMREQASDRTNIVKSWKTATASDPLVKGIRSSVKHSLSNWLNSPPVIETQRALTKADLDWAWKRSLAWRKAQKSDQPISIPILATFYDLKVYNGGDLSDLWYAHVRQFRNQHGDARAVLAEIANWVTKCQAFSRPDKAAAHRKLYSLKDLSASITLWQNIAQDEPSRFTDDVVDLLVLGYLRAQRSFGANNPDGFPGIYQADVLLRRGTEAVGEGFRGSRITLYK